MDYAVVNGAGRNAGSFAVKVGYADALALQILGSDCRDNTALADGIGEKDCLLSLRRHVHTRREVILARIQGGDACLERDISDLDVVAIGAGEADRDVDIKADVCAILDIGEGLVSGSCDHADRSVFSGQAAHVHDFQAFIGAKPYGVDLRIGSIAPDLFQKLI